jgi:hypothetical protein
MIEASRFVDMFPIERIEAYEQCTKIRHMRCVDTPDSPPVSLFRQKKATSKLAHALRAKLV